MFLCSSSMHKLQSASEFPSSLLPPQFWTSRSCVDRFKRRDLRYPAIKRRLSTADLGVCGDESSSCGKAGGLSLRGARLLARQQHGLRTPQTTLGCLSGAQARRCALQPLELGQRMSNDPYSGLGKHYGG